jgi:hypothetical protein
MAAGLGFKDFVTGEVLTAGDVDGYLMQGIWVFANATARDAAVTSPQEGNSCYLKDTDVIQVYSGSAWVIKSGAASPLTTKGDLYTYSTTDARLPVGTNGQTLVADSSTATGLNWVTAGGGGKVLQVVNAVYSTQAATTSTSYNDTGLTATITPSSATSKILVIVMQNGVGKVNDTSVDLTLLRGGTELHQFTGSAAFTNSTAWNDVGTAGITYLDSPATTSATTYKTQFKTGSSGNNAYVQLYGSTVADKATSSITLMEIGA